jgi:hypothetical protein
MKCKQCGNDLGTVNGIYDLCPMCDMKFYGRSVASSTIAIPSSEQILINENIELKQKLTALLEAAEKVVDDAFGSPETERIVCTVYIENLKKVLEETKI